MADKNKYGIVYLLTNPCMPGIVKIGMTLRSDLQSRMNELYSTGVPVPFECAYACQVPLDKTKDLETTLHDAFAPDRVNENREFFRINPNQAKVILKFITGLQDATSEVAEIIDESLTNQDKAASAKARSRRPALNFYDMGLHDGDILVYVDDPNITLEVISPKKVRTQEGEEVSLTAITTKIRNSKYAVQPTPWWLFNGRNLSDIYDETYPFEEE